ncbi:hypothetical protein DXG03_004570 [Asterophora parasitica]|uniref:Retrotransposon gag domain-containing protein n=1 Tax=Asterophora parasitica TaxID=117018 RepID=A0A9P7G0Y1_9AGAR|nr:hypothetical protein DXG03_004570 [Asterophora parasitica]
MDPHGFKDQQWTDPQWQAEGQTQGNPTPQLDQQPQGPTMAQPTWADFAQLGKAADVPKFLQDICDAVQLSRAQLPLKEDCCVYMASFLEDGSPKQWYTYVKKSETHLLQDFDAFCKAFEAHFGNPDITGNANNKLLALVQTGSTAAHASRYTELLIHVDWSEQTKIDNFYCSLKTSVKDVIVLTHLQDHPKVFKKYVNFVIKIDNCVHCCKQECKLEAKVNATKSATP